MLPRIFTTYWLVYDILALIFLFISLPFICPSNVLLSRLLFSVFRFLFSLIYSLFARSCFLSPFLPYLPTTPKLLNSLSLNFSLLCAPSASHFMCSFSFICARVLALSYSFLLMCVLSFFLSCATSMSLFFLHLKFTLYIPPVYILDP